MNPRSLSRTRIISHLNACYTTPVTAANTHATALSSTDLSNMLKQNVNGVPILRDIKQRQSKTERVTHVGFRRDAHDFKMHVSFSFRFRIMHIGFGSCRPNPFWPNVQEADSVVPLNEN